MFTVQGQRSPFLDELMEDGLLTLTDVEGQSIEEKKCPRCGRGVMVRRVSRHGHFMACTRRPCNLIQDLRASPGGQPLRAH